MSFSLRKLTRDAAALAKQHKAHLVTGDPKFKQVEGEVQVRWVA